MNSSTNHCFPFRVLALLDLYNVQDCKSLPLDLRSLAAVESYISNSRNLTHKGFSKILETSNSYNWSYSVTFNIETGKVLAKCTTDGRFALSEQPRPCAFFRKFGHDRFLKVTINIIANRENYHQPFAEKDFFVKGIKFGGSTFKFFGAKLLKGKRHQSHLNSINIEKTDDGNKFVAWFITDSPVTEEYEIETHFDKSCQGSFGNDPNFKILSPSSLRNWLGDFEGVDTVKINER